MKEENRLKTNRLKNNFTQNELAIKSGVSIRTIQRIEKGIAKGSPHTLRKIASALNIESKDLFGLEVGKQTDLDTNKLRLLNFSILSVLLIPFGNIIFPFLILLRHKSNETVNQTGRKIISFQIIATAILFFFTVVIFLSIGRGNGAIPLPVFICYAMYASVSIFMVIHTSLEINNQTEVLKFFPRIL